MSNPRYDERYKVFLERLPLNKYNVTKSAIEAGFSQQTAEAQQKRIMQQALKYQLQRSGIEVVKNSKLEPVNVVEVKKTMAELVGFSREELMSNLKNIATQEKDYSSRLKVVAPLAREYGVVLDTENNTDVTIPILNVTVKPRLSKATSNDDVAQYTLSVDKGLDGGVGATNEEEEEISSMPPL